MAYAFLPFCCVHFSCRADESATEATNCAQSMTVDKSLKTKIKKLIVRLTHLND
jgi:hypothetical protein